MKKTCSKCKQLKYLSEFGVKFSSSDGLEYACKKCKNKRQRELYNLEHPNKKKKRFKDRRDWKYQIRYGISTAEYENILKSQGYKCAICGTRSNTDGRRLAVDHCHVSNEVRGILCTSCNHGLGHFKDNIYNLKKAIEYLDG